MSATQTSTLLDTLTPVQSVVLKALVEGLSITAAAERGGVHRSTVHLWTRHHPTFARALLAARQDRADRLIDELGDLHELAINTFRQILSDDTIPASVRLRAAMEIVKVVQDQRPTQLAQLKAELHDEGCSNNPNAMMPQTIPLPNTAPTSPVRNAPCPCGSRLKYKRCCGNPLARAA